MGRYSQRIALRAAGRAASSSDDLPGWGQVLATLPAGSGSARLERLDPTSRLALVAGVRAVASAGLTPPLGAETGLVGATATGSQLANETFAGELAMRGPRLVSPQGFAQTLASAATGELAVALGARGPMTTMVGTCAGLQAVDLAVSWLEEDLGLSRVLVVAFDERTAAWEQSRAELTTGQPAGLAPPPPGRSIALVIERPSRPEQTGQRGPSLSVTAAAAQPMLGVVLGFGEAVGDGAVRRAIELALGSPAPLGRIDPPTEGDAVGPLEELVARLSAPDGRPAGIPGGRPAVAVARSALGPVAALAFGTP